MRIVWLTVVASLVGTGVGVGQRPPLADFERLVGGEWVADDGSYQMFEWGVGRRAVRARGYAPDADTVRLVSEAMWFRHPGEQAIRGVLTAVGMPIEFFDYTTWFAGDTLKSDFEAYGTMGGSYHEQFVFTDPDRYRWTVYARSADGLESLMTATYVRRD